MHTIQINSIPKNNPPYQIYVCDFFGNNCVLIGNVTINVPPAVTFNLPSQFDSAPAITIKIIDGGGCIDSQIYYCGYVNADKICKCDNVNTQNIYVFYDATSMDSTVASGASESFRTWYTGATTLSGYTGLLYEGVIGRGNNNGENWMWWGTYPYLGSLTGGTLSTGVEIKSFGIEASDVVLGTTGATSNFCQGGTDPCRPTIATFNDDSSEVIYQKINRGEDFITGLPLSGSGIMGVPFDKNELDGSASGIYGTFGGGDNNFTVICVIDESDGVVGLYTSTASMTAYTDSIDIFRLREASNPQSVFTGDVTTALFQPSSRFSAEYGKFLSVWEDIKLSNGSFNGLIYPIAKSGAPWTFNFIHHVIAAIEGETESDLYFSQKYDRNGQTWPFINPVLNNDNPTAYNFSGLQVYNTYTGLTSTSEYVNLPSQYKIGAGLKNFGWFTDPTVSAFTQSVVSDALNNFVTRVTAGKNCEYIVSDGSLLLNKIYYFDTETQNNIIGCYQVTEKNVQAQTDKVSPPLSSGVDFCFECGISSGVVLSGNTRFSSGFTFGYNTGAVQPPDNITNLMWSVSEFYDVLTGNGVNVIRYPGGTKGTYWDWKAGTFVTQTEYPRIPWNLTGLTTTPSSTLDFYTNFATTYGVDTIFMVNDYLRSVADQVDFLVSAQTNGLAINFIEIGQEYYLGPGADFFPDVGGFIAKFPTSANYATYSIPWIDSMKTSFPSASICIVGCIESGPATSRRRTWNRGLCNILANPATNPTSVYPDAISFHSYVEPGPTSYPNIETWGLTTLISEISDIISSIDNFNNNWSGVSVVNIWISEFGVIDRYSAISGTWMQGLYLVSFLMRITEINQVVVAINNSLFSGRQFGMMYSNSFTFGPNTTERFDLSSTGFLLGFFNRALNDSTIFESLDFSGKDGLTGKVFSGGTKNTILYCNITESVYELNFYSVLSSATITNYLTYDADPRLLMNYIDPDSLIKDLPTLFSSTTISNLSRIDVNPFSFSIIEYT